MLPILSGILVGRGKEISTRSAFSLSLVYVLAMAFTYALAGVIAGLFGHNLQALFQAPWVLASFSALFVLLALSMFGLFDIQLPGRWQTRLTEAAERQTRGTLHGVAVMGVFSAIIVGPCVAPPLAGALVYIGQSGDGVIGGAALFSMALGMGAPLLAVGTSAGRLLPKAGPWMENVKKVFGVIMLGLAIWLLERILPAPLTLFLWGLLLVGAAVFMGALDGIGAVASNWQRLSKGLGIVSLIYGSVLVVAAAGGATDVFRPLQSMQIAIGNTEVNTGVKFKSIKGVGALREELAAAKARHKAVMLDFYADWCTECKRLERHTFADSRVQHRLANAILLKADVTANDEQDRELLRAMGLHGPPAVLFFGPDAMEKRAFRLAGFLGPEEFTAHVQRALAL
jgi:thiol:disulfide interchange protein DsbD